MKNNNNIYDNIIETLDRIIAMQDRMIEKLNEVNDMMREMNNNISSKKMSDGCVASMKENKVWNTTGPR